jgi:RimJ/RimL family protein N-acetyltransferase
MSSSHWPILDLVIRTPRLELRPVREADASDLIDLAGEGIHDPSTTPFLSGFTDLPDDERARSTVQHYARSVAEWSAERWALHLVVRRDGECLGTQSIEARAFAVRRTVETGSWLGLAHQGHGVGAEMRAAVLELAFVHLGARRAESFAFADSAASIRVSEKLGYAPNGWSWEVRRGEPVRDLRFGLDREDWHCPHAVQVEGLTPDLLALFGVG